MPHAYNTLQLSITSPVATVTLHRPEVLNALNAQMFDDLEHVFRTLAADDSVRVVVVTGAGDRAFAAGADIRGLVALDVTSGEAFSRRGQHVFSQIENCGKPVIACINGVALGGGCELALACTFRLGSERAKIGLPELKLGLIPGYGGTQRLARLIGTSHALRFLLTSEPLNAGEALRLGLVSEVVAPEALLPRALELAHIIAAQAPQAVRSALEAVMHGGAEKLDDGLALEARLFGELCATSDKNEGVDAFLNKRTPQWQGR